MVDITERLRLNTTDWVFGNTATTALKEINKLRAELDTLREQNRALVEALEDLMDNCPTDWECYERAEQLLAAVRSSDREPDSKEKP